MYLPQLITAPCQTPVTLSEAKAHLRVDHGDDDALIQAFIQTATDLFDGWDGVLCRCLEPQTWRESFDIFQVAVQAAPIGRFMRMRLFPVIDIASIKYNDENGVEQTVDAGSYKVVNDAMGAIARFNNNFAFPVVSNEYPSVFIEYDAGYPRSGEGDASKSGVPQPLKTAILLLVAHWYENREATVVGQRAAAIALPFAVDALSKPFSRTKP